MSWGREGVWATLALCLLVSAAAQLRPNTDLSSHREDGVCQSVDVRNDVSAFARLRGCRVVEGFVQILLIDHANESSYGNISFPELREITNYLLLYRVNGLRTLNKLFPNLSVVRGHTLFLDYALVIYEMIHLQEVGLYSLTDILRGSVRIEKNPLLCYVETIDWTAVAPRGEQHFFHENRRKNECPTCSDSVCPKSSTGETLCWNRQTCQKECPKACGSRSCYEDGCCHEACLAGCTGPGPENCLVCRDVVFQNRCVKSCPVHTYKYLDRRCVQEQECHNMPVPRELASDFKTSTPWKPFNNSCILNCPPGYTEVGEKKLRCERCKGPCRKECSGASVDSISSAQKLRFCTYIKGSLEIQIRGGKNIVKELEESLNMVEEVEGYLKIVRSFPLVSLNFLKNLKVIHGKQLESQKYAFVVLDNQNLQELWDWNTRKRELQIKRGRVFFHFNPKLCLYKIERLRQVAGMSDFTELEVARNSNGDKVACNVTELVTNVTKKSSTAVIIEWNQFEHHDMRSLLGYVVYSTEAPYRNLTLYDGRDACGADGWKVDDVPVPEFNKSPSHNQKTNVYHILTFLKPYTQYAFYVKTYTIATERSGAQSKIKYFRTMPDTPSAPQHLKAYSNSSSTIVVQWQPPLLPNGNVTYYIVTGTWEKYDQEVLEQRNYCIDPLTLPDTKTTHVVPEEPPEKMLPEEACSCEEKVERKLPAETDALSRIQFEDTLHNMVYIKRSRHSRRKREISVYRPTEREHMLKSNIQKAFPNLKAGSSENTVKDQDKSIKLSEGVYQNFELIVERATTHVVHNLSHFSEYTVAVQACRERVPEDNSSSSVICSTKSMITTRTLQMPHADTINASSLTVRVSYNQSLPTVQLRWDEPQNPNGIIVTYQIEYRRVDIENYKPTVVCITRSQYLQLDHSYTLKKLLPGNYSLRLRATSLAGNGDYTEARYFYIVEHSSSTALEWVVGMLVGVLIVAGISFMTMVYVRRKYVPGVPNNRLFASVNPEYVPTVYIPDEWEVSRKKVELLRELGQGSFGMVYEGIGRDIVEGQPEIRCAIKTVNEYATDRERSEFLNEASVMKAFNTHHVVRLLGVVSQGQPVLVVMELMAYGDLKSYLRSHRPDVSDDPSKQPPTLKRILQMAIEIADGMAYLSAKKFVHRDLAARNCMVAEDLTVKIGDFGMTRDIYETDYYRKDTKGLLPVRWMAPESLKDGVFTSFSDVWSYGVVLWEMATLASQPYQGLSNDQVLRYVIDGGVMERPENCPDRLYELMRLCWQHKPTVRPPFVDLVTILLADVSPAFANVSFYHSPEGQDVRAQHTLPPSDDPTTPLRTTRDVEDFSLGSDLEDEEDEFPQYRSMSPIRALTSDANKVSNGSTVTTPTTANGWVVGRQTNGVTPSASTVMKTTEC